MTTNMNVKHRKRTFTWETIVTYTIGFSLILFCIYILLGDITTLTLSKTTRVDKIEFDDNLNSVSVEFQADNKLREYTKTYKEKDDYLAIRQSTNPKVTYNPYFKENVYIEARRMPTWGELILFTFGIFIIYLLMRYAVNIYRPKSE